ncbi:hypothetical protein DdX_12441 [Ditylenchus destructor]|uniref:Uncharacterized protein n=1 Tax=Ditylenchus destructor TaxID=166010 RepID=A0AAD4MV20_9BILA|nr:hypothetical protein DdX_12441 [Ditylenchus destructor]
MSVMMGNIGDEKPKNASNLPLPIPQTVLRLGLDRGAWLWTLKGTVNQRTATDSEIDLNPLGWRIIFETAHSYGQPLPCFDSLIDWQTEGSRCTLRKQFLTLSDEKTHVFTANPARRMSAVFVAVIVGSQQFVGWFFASSPKHIAPSLHFPRPETLEPIGRNPTIPMAAANIQVH